MSIVTRTGDQGATGLMYDRRVPKSHPRIEACGCLDELSAALGLARASADLESFRQKLWRIQNDLIVLMGELATCAEDLDRYRRDGFSVVDPGLTSQLEEWIRELESGRAARRGWAIPGATIVGAALDLARTVCRRAERRVCAVREGGETLNPEILVYLNRLSDLLWLLARAVEPRPDDTALV